MARSKSATATLSRTLPDHDHCRTHERYKLSCEQYERLLARSRQLCEICEQSLEERKGEKLNIDHDPEYPDWAVRGLLCRGCNTGLRDGSGRLIGGAEYLSRAWWRTECRRLGLRQEFGDEPPVGSVIRDQYGTIWVRSVDGAWHPFEGRCPKESHSWGWLYGRRGAHNLVPFNPHAGGASESTSLFARQALHAARREQQAFLYGCAKVAAGILAELKPERPIDLSGMSLDPIEICLGRGSRAQAEELVAAALAAVGELKSAPARPEGVAS